MDESCRCLGCQLVYGPIYLFSDYHWFAVDSLVRHALKCWPSPTYYVFTFEPTGSSANMAISDKSVSCYTICFDANMLFEFCKKFPRNQLENISLVVSLASVPFSHRITQIPPNNFVRIWPRRKWIQKLELDWPGFQVFPFTIRYVNANTSRLQKIKLTFINRILLFCNGTSGIERLKTQRRLNGNGMSGWVIEGRGD